MRTTSASISGAVTFKGPRSNKGGAVRGKSRASMVKAMNAARPRKGRLSRKVPGYLGPPSR